MKGADGAEFAGAAHDGAGFVFPIDFLLDAHGVACLDAGFDELAVAFRGAEIFDTFCSLS
jgi:hypothetical protein